MGQKDDKIDGKLLTDSDGMVSFHYYKNGQWRRKVLFQIATAGELLIKDPGTHKIVRIGRVINAEGINLFIFF